MSSIAKTNISLSKKDLTKSRIPPVASRNVVFYHKATSGQLIINLLSLTMPSSEMPTATQATAAEISGAQLTINKKNLDLVSSSKGKLIQNLDYIVIDSSTISLIGPYEGVGAEVDEIFVGTINSAPISDLVVASARTVTKSYTLAVNNAVLNLGQEFQVNAFPSENIGIIKVFVNGILAYRNTGNSSTNRDKDYYELDSGNGFGTMVVFNVPPVSVAHDIVVDFGVQAITDNNAIGAIENLAGSIKKIADDLAVVAGTTASDYYNASPSEVERRAFGDKVFEIENTVQSILNTKAEIRTKFLINTVSVNTSDISELRFNNLQIGRVYTVRYQFYMINSGGNETFTIISILNGGNGIARTRMTGNFADRSTYSIQGGGVTFTATSPTLVVSFAETGSGQLVGGSSWDNSWIQLIEELNINPIQTNKWD